jgi:hypothetical protein
MDRILKPNLTQINNVALGQTFTADLPIGPAYRYLDVIVTMKSAVGATLAGITDFLDLITLNVNQKAFRTFLAKEANIICTSYGSNYGAIIGQSSGAANTLTPVVSGGALTAPAANTQCSCWFRIYFEEPWRKTWAAANSRKFPTSWPAKAAGGASQTLSSFQIQGLIPNTTNNAGATALSVYIYAGTDASMGINDGQGNPITNSLKWYRFPGFTYSASGDQQLQNVVKYNKGQQLAILEEQDIFSQGTTPDPIDRVQVNADGRIVQDITSGENFRELQAHGFNLNWNRAVFQIVFDANDVITDGLFLSTAGGAYVNNLITTATLPSAGASNKTLVTISQIYGPLD